MKSSLNSVSGYLNQRVGFGQIHACVLSFSFPPKGHCQNGEGDLCFEKGAGGGGEGGRLFFLFKSASVVVPSKEPNLTIFLLLFLLLHYKVLRLLGF